MAHGYPLERLSFGQAGLAGFMIVFVTFGTLRMLLVGSSTDLRHDLIIVHI